MHSVGFYLLLSLILFLKTPFSTADQQPITFAFVVDTTSSMSDEIAAVKKGIKQIIEENVRQIEDYIVVPFNDPHVEPTFKSHDRNAMKTYLDGISVHGGGDCPEMAMSGLLKSIEMSRPKSFIFFFSDASPKDYKLYGQVISAANAKKLKIYFILTGCCNDCNSREFSAYRDVERSADAKIYQISKKGVETFMDYVVATAVSDLNSLRNPPKTFEEIPTSMPPPLKEVAEEKAKVMPQPPKEVPEEKAKDTHFCCFFYILIAIVCVMILVVVTRRKSHDHQD